jgi:microcystin-dependent protein
MSIFYSKTRANKGFPVGTILPWSGSSATIPKGWLACRSSGSLKVTDYPDLYRTIGNTYGGAPGVTFNLPNLNDGSSGVMDIFRGHYYYLKEVYDNETVNPERNLPHIPETTTISEDSFWINVGDVDNGDSTSNIQTNYISDFDIVGELQNINTLTGKFEKLVLVEGEFTKVLSVSGRKLSDVHIPAHSHPNEATTDDSYEAIGNPVADNGSSGQASGGGCGNWANFDIFCRITASCGCINRPVYWGTNGLNNMSGMVQGIGDGGLGDTNAVPWNAIAAQYPAYGQNGLRFGGGAFGSCSGGETSSVCYVPGDGFSGGDMYSHISGQKYFFTSLAPSSVTSQTGSAHFAEAEALRSFERVVPHFHGAATITFSSKYIRVNSPVVINDIQLGSVQINNTTGENFGIISINTATPTLTMQYIIRAY